MKTKGNQKIIVLSRRLQQCHLFCSTRLDRYRGNPDQQHKDCFDFECHIYVDDAFMTDKESGKRLVNAYVNDLIQVVIEVYR